MLDVICSDDFLTRTNWSFNLSFKLNTLQHILLHCQPSPLHSNGRQFFYHSVSSSARFKTFSADITNSKLCETQVQHVNQQLHFCHTSSNWFETAEVQHIKHALNIVETLVKSTPLGHKKASVTGADQLWEWFSQAATRGVGNRWLLKGAC